MTTARPFAYRVLRGEGLGDRFRRYLYLFILLHLISCSLPPSSPKSLHSPCPPLPPHNVLAVSHRGETNGVPENSLGSISAAAARGVRIIELDVRESREGALVLFHDKRFSKRNIASPYWLSGKSLSHTPLGMLKQIRLRRGSEGEHPPTLRQVYAHIRTLPVFVQLDIKGGDRSVIDMSKKALELANRYGVLEKTIIQCRSTQCLATLRKNFPDALLLGRVEFPYHLYSWLSYSPTIMQVDTLWLTPGVVSRFERHGTCLLLKALGPHRDTPESWKALSKRGARLILTDRAAELTENAHIFPYREIGVRPDGGGR